MPDLPGVGREGANGRPATRAPPRLWSGLDPKRKIDGATYRSIFLPLFRTNISDNQATEIDTDGDNVLNYLFGKSNFLLF